MGALRNYRIAVLLAKNFGNLHIITSKKTGEQVQAKNMTIQQVETFDYKNIVRLFKSKSDTPAIPEFKKPSLLWWWAVRLLDTIPFNILLGEGGLAYVWNAYRQASQLIKERQINLVYTSFRPYADVLVGWLLKRKFPHLCWVADFRDPHVDPNRRNVFFPRLQHRINRAIFSKADIVTTVSGGLAKHFRQYHPDIQVVLNGFPEALLQAAGEKSLPNSKFTITYTGSLYYGWQSADVLWKSLAKLINEGKIAPDKIRIVYAGKDQSLWRDWMRQYKLENISEIHPYLAHNTSLQLQQRSDLNLMLTWSSSKLSGILTGKLFEYIAVQKPVLAIVQGEKDQEIFDIFSDTNAGLCALNEDAFWEKTENFILELYRNWLRDGHTGWQFKKDQLLQYSAEQQFDLLLEKLEKFFPVAAHSDQNSRVL